MTEYYVKYRKPKLLFEFEPGFDIPYEDIDNGDFAEVFLTDSKGAVMIFQSKAHAKAQIHQEKIRDWKFKRWAKDIKIVRGESL